MRITLINCLINFSQLVYYQVIFIIVPILPSSLYSVSKPLLDISFHSKSKLIIICCVWLK